MKMMIGLKNLCGPKRKWIVIRNIFKFIPIIISLIIIFSSIMSILSYYYDINNQSIYQNIFIIFVFISTFYVILFSYAFTNKKWIERLKNDDLLDLYDLIDKALNTKRPLKCRIFSWSLVYLESFSGLFVCLLFGYYIVLIVVFIKSFIYFIDRLILEKSFYIVNEVKSTREFLNII